MIKWKITKKKGFAKICVHYNDSPIVSYWSGGSPYLLPVIDRRIITDVDSEIDKMMDILEHKSWLSKDVKSGFAIEEMLGI
jgi:hypothetical protein